MRLKLILFDLWGTLIQMDGPEEGRIRDELRQRMVSDVLAERGLSYEAPHIARAFVCAGTELAGVHESGRDLTAEGRTVLYMRHLDPELGDRLDGGAWDRLHKAILTPALSTLTVNTIGPPAPARPSTWPEPLTLKTTARLLSVSVRPLAPALIPSV